MNKKTLSECDIISEPSLSGTSPVQTLTRFVAEMPQLVDAGDDSALLARRRKWHRDGPEVAEADPCQRDALIDQALAA